MSPPAGTARHALPRYRFGDFVLSPRQRVLAKAGREQSLIPRYFDLLVLLVERRHEAVHRREIFDLVWHDVIVSDGALSQAMRTLRRTLGDDSREPRFIRTVSRHGYRFVFPEVSEEADEGPMLAVVADVTEGPASGDQTDEMERLLDLLTTSAPRAAGPAAEEDRREAAERLHVLGTAEALRRLGTRGGHSSARALLRDTRWDVPGAGHVPLLGQPAAIRAAAALVVLRLRRAAKIATARWAAASAGGAAAGLLGGGAGGALLAAAPGSDAPLALIAVLAALGAVAGAIGGGGVGIGLSAAEATARSHRTAALVTGAAAGGGSVGIAVQWLGRWSLAGLVGLHVQTGGALEGLILGGLAGLGYALTTARMDGGLAAPSGRRRVRTAAAVAIACGLGALGLTLAGRPLVGGTVHAIAQAARGSQALLTPLGRLLGEPDFGPATRAVIGTGEGALFGLGLTLGLTRRPSRRSQ